jgi:hypothetical protein
MPTTRARMPNSGAPRSAIELPPALEPSRTLVPEMATEPLGPGVARVRRVKTADEILVSLGRHRP